MIGMGLSIPSADFDEERRDEFRDGSRDGSRGAGTDSGTDRMTLARKKGRIERRRDGFRDEKTKCWRTHFVSMFGHRTIGSSPKVGKRVERFVLGEGSRKVEGHERRGT